MKIYTRNFNGVFDDILNHVDSVSIEEADKVLAWQDILPDWVNTVNYAHELGKEVILMTQSKNNGDYGLSIVELL